MEMVAVVELIKEDQPQMEMKSKMERTFTLTWVHPDGERTDKKWAAKSAYDGKQKKWLHAACS